MEEKGFFTTETIQEVQDTLKGIETNVDGRSYYWRINEKMKIMSANSERFLGHASRIAFGITREMAPIYVLGDPDPRMYSRGKRGVAGTIEIDGSELIQFYTDQPMRVLYEEIVDDKNVQIIIDGVELIAEGENLTVENIIHSEDSTWTFIGRKATVKKMPANNRGYSNELLKKEWIPQWPALEV